MSQIFSENMAELQDIVQKSAEKQFLDHKYKSLKEII
jgi:hypothetical protein